MAVSLESICKKISSGGTPSRKNAEYFTAAATGHLWVKSKELLDNAIGDTEERISEEGLKNSSAKFFPAHAVLVAMYGANVGQLGWLKAPATVNQAICGLVVDEGKADWRYVFYSLLQNRGDLTIQAQGAAQQNLNQDLIRQFAIDLPPLPIQRRIAGIMSAYDELIENSQRRIKILELMARALYREWFVHLRFPGHEAVPRVSSLLGEIPRGWEVRTVGEVAALVSRGPSLTYVDADGVPVVNQRCIRNEEIDMQAVQYAAPLPEKKSHLYLQPRDILINSMGVGTLGRVSRNLSIDEPTIIHNCITVVRVNPEEHTTAFLYYRLSDCQFHFESLGVGATGQTSLRIEDIEDVTFFHPPVALLSAFEEVALPIWTHIGVLKRKTHNLRRARDLLLPRLLSGQIDVEAMSA